MDIGGKTLTVQRANIKAAPPPPPSMSMGMGMPMGIHGLPPPPGMIGMGMPGMPGMQAPPAQFSMPGVDVSKPVLPTRVLVLMNMVDENELRDDGEYVVTRELARLFACTTVVWVCVWSW
jgi:hypothetical protein